MPDYELINEDGSCVVGPEVADVPALPAPRLAGNAAGLAIREATLADLPFIDAQQKARDNRQRLGFLFEAALIGKIEKKQVLVAEHRSGECSVASGQPGTQAGIDADSLFTTGHLPLDTGHSPASPVGYLIAQDRYLKRDDLGLIVQMCVVPGSRRKLVAAHLLQAQFDRSAYGCRLYGCWCAQDLRSANEFWEAMGFVPLAFRTGSETTKFVDLDGVKRTGGRIHIYWQKRIRPSKARKAEQAEGDGRGFGEDYPYWYPSETSGGAIGAERIVLPNPLGTKWWDIKPVVLPAELLRLPEPPDAPDAEEPGQPAEGAEVPRRGGKQGAVKVPSAAVNEKKLVGVNGFGVSFGPSPEQLAQRQAERAAAEEAARLEAESAKRKKAAKRKSERARLKTLDPALCAYSRELRDRWSEAVCAGSAGAELLESAARPKYRVGRVLALGSEGRDAVFLNSATAEGNGRENVRRLAA